MKKIRLMLVIFWLVLGFSVGACSNQDSADYQEFLVQPKWDAHIGQIYGSRTVGQTFIARAPKLSKIGVLLARYTWPATKEVIFHLKLNPYEEETRAELESAGPTVGEIWGSKTVGQSFLCDVPTLSGIKVLMANYGDRPNTQDVIFHLKENLDAQEDLRTTIVNASNIADNQHHEFSFPRLSDTQGKLYYFYLESPKSRPGDAITVRYNPGKPEEKVYVEEERYLNGIPVPGNLFLKLVSESDLVTLKMDPRQIKPGEYHQFSFSPIPGSYGKSYYFYIESPDSQWGNAITLRYQRSDSYPRGKMYINGVPFEGDLTFSTSYYVGSESFAKLVVWNFFYHLCRETPVPFLVFYSALCFLVFFLSARAIFRRRKITRKAEK